MPLGSFTTCPICCANQVGLNHVAFAATYLPLLQVAVSGPSAYGNYRSGHLRPVAGSNVLKAIGFHRTNIAPFPRAAA